MGLIWRLVVFVLGNSWVRDRHQAVSGDGGCLILGSAVRQVLCSFGLRQSLSLSRSFRWLLEETAMAECGWAAEYRYSRMGRSKEAVSMARWPIFGRSDPTLELNLGRLRSWEGRGCVSTCGHRIMNQPDLTPCTHGLRPRESVGGTWIIWTPSKTWQNSRGCGEEKRIVCELKLEWKSCELLEFSTSRKGGDSTTSIKIR